MDGILELADVPGPRVVHERVHHVHRNRLDAPAQPSDVVRNEVADEEGDVLGPLAKGLQLNREVGRDEVARLEVSREEHAQQILHHAPDDLAAREAPAFEVGELSPPPVAREDRADTVLELAVVGRRHGVTTLDRLLPDVGLDEPEMLINPPRDLREDIRGALVAGSSV